MDVNQTENLGILRLNVDQNVLTKPSGCVEANREGAEEGGLEQGGDGDMLS